jgi:YggT family protein
VVDLAAIPLVPADALSTTGRFVSVFIVVYSLLIFAYVITSWIRLPYSLSSFQQFLYDVCEPYLRIFRRILPPLGAIDLSPLAAVAVLYLVERLVNQGLLDHLH